MKPLPLKRSLAKYFLALGIVILAAHVVAAPNLRQPTPPREFPILGPGKILSMTLKGKLVKFGPMDNQSTGWALILDSNVKFDGKKLERIEVDPLTTDVGEFENKHVEIKGRPAWAEGSPERGFFPLIELSDIREVSS